MAHSIGNGFFIPPKAEAQDDFEKRFEPLLTDLSSAYGELIAQEDVQSLVQLVAHTSAVSHYAMQRLASHGVNVAELYQKIENSLKKHFDDKNLAYPQGSDYDVRNS